MRMLGPPGSTNSQVMGSAEDASLGLREGGSCDHISSEGHFLDESDSQSSISHRSRRASASFIHSAESPGWSNNSVSNPCFCFFVRLFMDVDEFSTPSSIHFASLDYH